MNTTPAGGPTLSQRRNLVTAIPGPASTALLERKTRAVASGVGVMLPVFTVAAGGGILLDADGNSLIDLGSGIAVTGVGNAAPRVVAARSGAPAPAREGGGGPGPPRLPRGVKA